MSATSSYSDWQIILSHYALHGETPDLDDYKRALGGYLRNHKTPTAKQKSSVRSMPVPDPAQRNNPLEPDRNADAARQTTASMPPSAYHAPIEQAIAEAQNAAKAASNLSQLQENMQNFEGCELKATARQLVFADGQPDARIMLIGEAPPG